MPEINLLNTEVKRASIPEEIFLWLMRLLAFILLLAFLYFGYTLFALSRTNASINDEEQKIDQATQDIINNSSRDEVVTRQGQLQQVDTLIQDHVYWSKFFPELARVTLQSAVYSTFSANPDGTAIVTVLVPDYATLDNYLQVFDLPDYNKTFSNVRLVSTTNAPAETGGGIQARISLKYNPEYLKKSK